MVAVTSLVKKNHQIPRIINQKIAQKLIEKTSMIDIAHQLAISTSTVIRKLNDFRFKSDFSYLPEIMSWDEYAFTKGKMSFIAQNFENLNIITILEGRTQAIIRNHFLRYDRSVRCQVKIITMVTVTILSDFQIYCKLLKANKRGENRFYLFVMIFTAKANLLRTVHLLRQYYSH